MTAKNKRYTEIDALKGFGIALVVFYHSIIVYPINLREASSFLNDLATFINTIQMPLFFAVSGFLYYYHKNYANYILKKFKRLMIPYFFFSVLDLLPRLLFPQFINQKQGLFESIMNILFYGGHYWFLYTLFFLFMLYPLIDKLNKNKKISIVLLMLLFFISSLSIGTSFFKIDSVIQNICFFNLGHFIKKYYPDIFELKLSKLKRLFFMLILFIIWVVVFKLNINNNLFISEIESIIGLVLLFLVSKYQLFIDSFERYSKYTLNIYCLNGFFLTVSRTVICKLTSISIIIVLFNFIFDFFGSYILSKEICSRSKIARFLCGTI